MLSTLHPFTLAAITTLSLLTFAPTTPAQSIAANSPVISLPATTAVTTPFHLVHLAYQGNLSGTPGYQGLITGYQQGQIQAQDLVQQAIQANRLPQSTLSNGEYLNAVEQQLQTLSNSH